MHESPEQRFARIRDLQGVPLLDISYLRLVRKSDWEEFTGARYPQNSLWVKRKSGAVRFTGNARGVEK